jgi:hypothetical protein
MIKSGDSLGETSGRGKRKENDGGNNVKLHCVCTKVAQANSLKSVDKKRRRVTEKD